MLIAVFALPADETNARLGLPRAGGDRCTLTRIDSGLQQTDGRFAVLLFTRCRFEFPGGHRATGRRRHGMLEPVAIRG